MMKDNVIFDVRTLSQALLPELGERQSMSLILFYFYGRRHAAYLLNISSCSVRDNIYRARIKLKHIYGITDVEAFLINRILQKFIF